MIKDTFQIFFFLYEQLERIASKLLENGKEAKTFFFFNSKSNESRAIGTGYCFIFCIFIVQTIPSYHNKTQILLSYHNIAESFFHIV